LQHPQPLRNWRAYKDVAWKKNQLEFFAAVFPSPHRPVEGQKVFNSALLELLCDLLLMARVGVRRVPPIHHRLQNSRLIDL
jgi:hypothetical protein